MTAAVDALRAHRRPAAMSPVERFERHVVCVLGLPFDVLDLPAAVAKVRSAALANERLFVSTPNLNFAMTARADPAFRDSVLRSDLCLADGAPIVWMARRSGAPLAERVAGATLFEALRAHTGQPLNVFFFGAPPGVAEAACRALNARPGGLRCVGHDAAGYGSLDDMSGPARLAAINRSGAHFVVAALGAGKGQAWIERNAAALDAPVLCHLGAVVNFVAGAVQRAPLGVQRLGLEWLWRIKEEPALWRRYGRDGLALVGALTAVERPVKAGRGEPEVAVHPEHSIAVASSGSTTTISLRGRCTIDHLGPLRHALAEASVRDHAIELVMAGVTELDASAIGTLLLAHGTFGTDGLRLVDISPTAARSLRQCGAGWLMDGPKVA